jgi:hypothetical protein
VLNRRFVCLFATVGVGELLYSHNPLIEEVSLGLHDLGLSEGERIILSLRRLSHFTQEVRALERIIAYLWFMYFLDAVI